MTAPHAALSDGSALSGGVMLTGDRVLLREFRADDLDDCMAIVGDERVVRFLSFEPRSRDETASMLAGAIERAHQVPRPEYYLGITLPTVNRVIGFARLGLSGVRAAKLGYAIAFRYQRRGHATDAARTLLNFAFGPLELHRVTAAIGPDNTASQAVVARLGFTREGRLRDHVYTDGGWRDSDLFSVLAHEWFGSTSE
jgi:ribosomal-protein-alanine N-acetyltransferase